MSEGMLSLSLLRHTGGAYLIAVRERKHVPAA
jgi:hypothetical protein